MAPRAPIFIGMLLYMIACGAHGARASISSDSRLTLEATAVNSTMPPSVFDGMSSKAMIAAIEDFYASLGDFRQTVENDDVKQCGQLCPQTNPLCCLYNQGECAGSFCPDPDQPYCCKILSCKCMSGCPQKQSDAGCLKDPRYADVSLATLTGIVLQEQRMVHPEWFRS
mmetsp:Transcript_21748/g.40415  ORF Transcript_21748/g.40415 Transcript_21748/m.40415 type:complete len:169 (+) Transcript_21748:108-614(+)